MIKEYFHIAHLISRHLSGEVTPEESRFLDKWRKESKSHEQLFQKICSDEHYVQHEIRKMEFDSQAGWKGVETRIKRMELRRRHLKLLRYVALFIAPVLILVFALQDISVPHVMDGNQLLAAQQILPGGAKAILTLDNGETVYLDENADGRQLQLAGKQIQIDSTTLNYSAADGQVVQSALVYNKVEVPQGGEYTLVLNDGTKVHLNSMSSLRFPLTFEAGKREVELAGEAYFEVSVNKNTPFYVHTSKGEIKVLGTHFNLEAYSNADVFKTSLFEGKVRVRVKGNNIYLKPDQMVCYHKNGKIHLETIHDYDQYRWREGLICIKSAKFKDIMKTFTKYFGDSIVVQNKEVEHYKYTGKFRQSRGVINALRLLQKDAPFTIEQDEDKQIIFIK